MATKKPFTDEQKDMLMDYLFNKFMNDMMNSKERSEDIYNQPRKSDPVGNELIEAKSNNALMDMLSKALKDTASEGIKGIPTKEDLEKIKSTTPEDKTQEGIMTAQQYEQGGDLNYTIEMLANETDPDKQEELKSIIREMLGVTPYMSIRQTPDFKKG